MTVGFVDASEEEADLDWGEASEDPDAEEAVVSEARSTERTSVRFPTQPIGGGTWREFFADVKSRDRARKAGAATVTPYVTSSRDAEAIPTSPAGILKSVDALAWDRTVREFTVHHPDDYYAGDSKATGASAGDLKTPAHDVDHLAMLAKHPGGRLGFYAEWIQTVTAKGAPGAKFVYALIVDPVGLPREMHYHYKIDKRYGESMGWNDEVRAEKTTRLSIEYNDGDTALHKIVTSEKAADLTAWLEEWMKMLVPGYVPKERAASKKQKQAEATAADLLQEGEWTG